MLCKAGGYLHDLNRFFTRHESSRGNLTGAHGPLCKVILRIRNPKLRD